ncbi:SHOCT domain-containing protein [Baekduia soli]|uniref:SHOCT domain-containing protein n=1 Tax=Baekduia soli TaxID=496014 RepID=A0A5B8U4U1_9ACTN|nr:SHOCT domain-containing protein [Baekduia soli]QEC47961.1 SHOCT domain-containing protein [Baekduia soli]
MPEKHGLGFGHGRIVEYEDGTAAYLPTGAFTKAFRVRIADVTGFAVAPGKRTFERTLTLLGAGGALGSVKVNQGTPEVVETWFRTHPDFGGAARAAPGADLPPLVADELRKLAALRSEGVLSEDEFAALKARLLGD